MSGNKLRLIMLSHSQRYENVHTNVFILYRDKYFYNRKQGGRKACVGSGF